MADYFGNGFSAFNHSYINDYIRSVLIRPAQSVVHSQHAIRYIAVCRLRRLLK